MKSKLTRNLGWKIVSLLASIILWMVVNTVSNPSVTQNYYNIPVVLENVEKITSSGRVYEVLENTDVIPKVTIKAPRSIISEIDEDDIIAKADVSELSKLDTISIDLSTNIYSDQINSIKGSIDTVRLKIENKKTKSLLLNIDTIGTVGDGHMVGNISVGQNVVNITGAESLVNNISKACVEIDVSGFTSDIVTSTDIKLYDADGVQLDTTDLSMNIKSISVQVEILETKKVGVHFDVNGTPASGYMVTGQVDSDKTEVNICGKSSAIKNIEYIDIPKETIDITEAKEDVVVSVNIKNYLPEGIQLVDVNDNVYKVTVHIEPINSRSISVTTEDVSIVGVPEDYSATHAIDPGEELKISGLSADIMSLSLNGMKPVVDIEKWMSTQDDPEIKEGFYTIEVSFTLPDKVKIEEPVKAVVHLVKKTEE